MEESKIMEFHAGFKILWSGKMTFNEARRFGFELAKQFNTDVTLYVCNEYLGKWQKMSLIYQPNGLARDTGDGKLYKLDADGRNLWEATQEQIKAAQK